MDKWDKRFLEMAKLVSSWSSCYQENRQVGAVIVKDGKIIARAHNLREQKQNSLCHAEISAINKACKKLGVIKCQE